MKNERKRFGHFGIPEPFVREFMYGTGLSKPRPETSGKTEVKAQKKMYKRWKKKTKTMMEDAAKR